MPKEENHDSTRVDLLGIIFVGRRHNERETFEWSAVTAPRSVAFHLGAISLKGASPCGSNFEKERDNGFTFSGTYEFISARQISHASHFIAAKRGRTLVQKWCNTLCLHFPCPNKSREAHRIA